MASAVLAGLNPAHGFYAVLVGIPVGGLATASVHMIVLTTGAVSLATGSALSTVAPDERTGAVVLLTLLVGAVQIGCGLLRLGGLTHFISNAVMTGFFTGVAVRIVLSQVPDLTGFRSEAGGALPQTFDLLLHPTSVHLPTLAIGLLTLALILSLERTRLAPIAMVGALAAAATAVPVFDWTSVPLVGTTNTIPRGIPRLVLPDLADFSRLAFAAVGIAMVAMIQGAGIGQTTPNPDGRYPDPSRDFVGQGVANVAAAFVRGMPIGGSLSATALALNAGAQSRLTQVVAGACILLTLVLLGGVVESIPMAALAALLVLAGIQAIRPQRVRLVWHTSHFARLAMLLTFVATLLFPTEDAIVLGVLASFALELYRSADRVRLVELVPGEGDSYREGPAPEVLTADRATILQPSGTLFFAGARRIEEDLPRPPREGRAVVLLTLRDRTELGSTFVGVLGRYAEALKVTGGKLMLVGVKETVRAQLARTGILSLIGEENVFPVEPVVGAPLHAARAAAETWLERTALRRDGGDGGVT
jgi:SulP family sulfate permease